MIRLEPRALPSAAWTWAAPFLALAITVLLGVMLFTAMGKDPVAALRVFFWEPIKSPYALGELVVKATPLLIIALGLALCFRANVWNIGAEGQYVMGAIFASGVALQLGRVAGAWAWVMLAGVIGGMVWAAMVAWLRERFHANEILVSLMLVYVAVQVLGYLVFGPWKDPAGYNFPQTQTFDAATRIPRFMSGSRMHWGMVLAVLGVVGLWVFCFAPGPVGRNKWLVQPPWRRAMPGFLHAKPCGWLCWCLGALRVWPGAWRWPAPLVSSRLMCRWATDLPPSSWPLSDACIRWAWCFQPC